MVQSLYTTQIIVNLQVDGLHFWKDCPHKDVDFLRYLHRHMFYVTIKCLVTHNDREKELFMVRERLTQWFYTKYDTSKSGSSVSYNFGSRSCEMICQDILAENADFTYARVMEDNENGAEMFRN